MASTWQRKRSPDDVPTPIAVALSDFCRRAGAPASPTEVREALSLLAEEDDFRVRSLTDGEPKASPLGPWAVIDVLGGTPESVAAARQGTGYYELARELVDVREQRAPAVSEPVRADGREFPVAHAHSPQLLGAPSASTASATVAETTGKKRDKKAPAPTISERIAPKKRTGAARALPEDLPALEPVREREPMRPKGRFANVAPARSSVEDLFQSQASNLLSAKVEQHPHRYAMTRALGDTYGGRKEGQPLRTEDVERALQHHKLFERLAKKERELVLGSYTEQRGAAGRVAYALGLSVPELSRLQKSLGITQEVEEIRERFRREALASKNLAARLDLLGRGKYLSDLGIVRRFDEALRADLKRALNKYAPEARDLTELYEVIARRERTQAELVARTVEKLGLSDEARKLMPGSPDPNYAS